MARIAGRFTKLGLDKLTKTPGLHCDGGGLYLSVASPPSNACSWLFRYMISGRARAMGLGPYPEISLAEARAAAAEARRLKAHGQDPLGEKEAGRLSALVAAAKAMTFKDCADAYIRDHGPRWGNAKTSGQWEASMRDYVFPIIGSLPVQDIDTGLVMKVLKQDVPCDKGAEQFWMARCETASRVRSRIENILDWAETNGYRPPGKNPARWKGHLDNNLPPRSKVRPIVGHPDLPVEAVAEFVSELRTRAGMGAKALELLILTAVRTNEALGAHWSEFDLDKGVWIIPAARMKARQQHRVPLSDRAIAILKVMWPAGAEPGDFVFPGRKPGRPLAPGTLLETLHEMGRNDMTVHGLRSTFRNWCAETGIAPDLAERCLAHTVKSRVEAAYLRTDVLEPRRPIMQAWADHCEGRVSGENVVMLKSA